LNNFISFLGIVKYTHGRNATPKKMAATRTQIPKKKKLERFFCISKNLHNYALILEIVSLTTPFAKSLINPLMFFQLLLCVRYAA
jgi:hypothetical protein